MKRIWVLAIAVSAAAASVSAVPGPVAAPPAAALETPPTLRLPKTARPLGYAVDLTVVPEKEAFSGVVDIEIQLDRPVRVIWVNATGLAISEASLETKGRRIPARILPGGEDFVGFSFKRPAGPGQARLRVLFTGNASGTSTTGIFHQQAGEDWYAFTQFEAIDARRAFPCFDEPSWKVPWRLTLRVPERDIAVANTPVASEKALGGGMKAIAFAQTRPLPSYLVAFGVGPFDVVEAGRAGKNATPIRMIVPRGRGREARWAAETAGPMLEVLESYFGIPFPYSKLDNLVIPQTVRFGAMENAGLVTWNESILLATPEHETPRFKREWASIYAHETAHQWFGDLVTLAWWNDTWLNESFATWMAEKVLEKWKPEWETPVDRVISRAQTMAGDKLVSARKIRQPIESKGDIDNAFDNISYGKGSAVLSMFEAWAGPEKFQKGVRRYLAAHADANATAEDFLAALEAEAGTGLAKAFSTFLDQAGVPLLTLRLSCGVGQPPSLGLSQRRLLPKGSPPTAAQLWSIPVCVRYGAEGWSGKTCRLMTAAESRLSLPEARGCPAWVLGNAGELGYYAVDYEEGLLGKLLAGRPGPLTLPERVGVLEDVATLAGAGQLPLPEALAIVPDFAGDANPHIVSTMVRIAEGVHEHLVPDGRRASYERFVRKSFGARARALGWNPKPGEDEETRLLRPDLLRLVARAGKDPELRAEAHRLALAWLDDPKAVDPDTLGTVLAVAAEDGDRALFERFRARVEKTPERRDRARLFTALGRFRDPAIEKDALALVLSTDFDIRESIGILRGALGERETRSAAWDFFKANFDALLRRLPQESGGTLPRFGRVFCDAAHRADVESFFRGRIEKLTGARRALAETLESIDQCVALARDQSAAVGEFLAKY
jgi:alanyl aminopeptidase